MMLANIGKEAHLFADSVKLSFAHDLSIGSVSEKQAAFAQYIAEYGRSYASKDTVEERFNIFSANFDKIMAHNSNENRTFSMGLNEFADMTLEELENRYLSAKLRAPKHTKSATPHLRQSH